MDDNHWLTLVYFIACPRRDGTAPDINKAWGERIFLTYIKPVTKELGMDQPWEVSVDLKLKEEK